MLTEVFIQRRVLGLQFSVFASTYRSSAAPNDGRVYTTKMSSGQSQGPRLLKASATALLDLQTPVAGRSKQRRSVQFRIQGQHECEVSLLSLSSAYFFTMPLDYHKLARFFTKGDYLNSSSRISFSRVIQPDVRWHPKLHPLFVTDRTAIDSLSCSYNDDHRGSYTGEACLPECLPSDVG